MIGIVNSLGRPRLHSRLRWLVLLLRLILLLIRKSIIDRQRIGLRWIWDPRGLAGSVIGNDWPWILSMKSTRTHMPKYLLLRNLWCHWKLLPWPLRCLRRLHLTFQISWLQNRRLQGPVILLLYIRRFILILLRVNSMQIFNLVYLLIIKLFGAICIS